MDTTISVPIAVGESLALIVLGRTRGIHRIQSISPPALRVEEEAEAILVEWPSPSEPFKARVIFRSWGAPFILAFVRAYTLARYRELKKKGGLEASSNPTTLEDWRKAATLAALDHHKARAFFNALDSKTAVWSEDLDNVKALLQGLFEKRWGGANDPTASSSPSPLLLTQFQTTAQLFTDLFAPFTDIEEIRDAFDLFARGELSLLGSTVPVPAGVQAVDVEHACQPDSVFHYLYAEFAQVCVQHGIVSVGTFPSPQVWQDLLPTLVHSHKLFCKAYGDAAGKFDANLATTGKVAPGKLLANIRAERGASLTAMPTPLDAWANQLRSDVFGV